MSSVSEADLQGFVMDAARLGGWLATHFRPARTNTGWRTALSGDVGFPDTVLVHQHLKRCVFAELKSAKGKLSPDQEGWIAALRSVPGVEAYVWRPDDQPEIERQLLGHLTARL